MNSARAARSICARVHARSGAFTTVSDHAKLRDALGDDERLHVAGVLERFVALGRARIVKCVTGRDRYRRSAARR